MYPPSEKVGGHVPRVPHQIVPMAGDTSLRWWCWRRRPVRNTIFNIHDTHGIITLYQEKLK